jgi:hypothetical protein
MMNDPRQGASVEFDEGVSRRRRALWGLLTLAFAAVIIASLMLLFGHPGKSGRSVAPPPANDAGSPTTEPAGTGSHAASPTPSSSRPAGSLAPPVIHAGNPCPAQPSCTVPGDAGLVSAVNKYRTDHHLPAAVGTVSTNAQTCALHRGSGSTCVPHYVWTNVPNQDPALAVSKIADFADSWMLDPGIQRFEVGWAWNGRSWDCVLLKSP